jgi:hypothetical protein
MDRRGTGASAAQVVVDVATVLSWVDDAVLAFFETIQAKCFDQYQASREQKRMEKARGRIHRLLKDFVDKLPARI